MENLPEEIVNKIFTYISSPTADIMRPQIQAYNLYAKVISKRYELMPFVEFMSVNAIYLDLTSKRHLREQNRILKTFIN